MNASIVVVCNCTTKNCGWCSQVLTVFLVVSILSMASASAGPSADFRNSSIVTAMYVIPCSRPCRNRRVSASVVLILWVWSSSVSPSQCMYLAVLDPYSVFCNFPTSLVGCVCDPSNRSIL